MKERKKERIYNKERIQPGNKVGEGKIEEKERKKER